MLTGRRMARLFYKPFGIILGILAGHLAGKLFKHLWELAAAENPSPRARDRDRGWSEIIAAAVIRGAVYGGVRAAVDRAGATGFEHLTGSWPGRASTRSLPATEAGRVQSRRRSYE